MSLVTVKGSLIIAIALVSVLLPFTAVRVVAGSATWNANPTSNSWTNSANWTPATVPDGVGDTATFNTSTITAITDANVDNLSSIIFNPGASSYSLSGGVFHFVTTVISGAGIVNNSGVNQTFTIHPSSDDGKESALSFTNSASAGELTQFFLQGNDRSSAFGGEVVFHDTATAGAGTFMTLAGTSAAGASPGTIYFNDSATVGNATFINRGIIVIQNSVPTDGGNGTFMNLGGSIAGQAGGSVMVNGSSSAGAGTFFAEGPEVAGAMPGAIYLTGTASGGTATFIANPGVGRGGLIEFFLFSSPAVDNARFEVFGNGTLDTSAVNAPGTTIGSLEGDGLVSIGPKVLTIGTRNVDTTFSGTLQDNGIAAGAGSIEKAGSGSLTLTGANTYSGMTTISDGTLIVSNTSGSATGTGPVRLKGGGLSGGGIIAGAVTVGNRAGALAHLAPAVGRKQQSLTILDGLDFEASAYYDFTFKARGSGVQSDQVTANGVTIHPGAKIVITGLVRGNPAPGLTIKAINNSSALPIAGEFKNLREGQIVAVSGHNFVASYSGGDGNDLTLSLQP